MEAVTARPRDNLSIAGDRSSREAAEATLEFGRFRVLLRQRQLVARCRRGEPEDANLRVAQGSRRRPRLYPHRVRPRLPVHSRSSIDRHPECWPATDAAEALAEAKVVFPTDFSATAAWLGCSELRLADASILLKLRALHPARRVLPSICLVRSANTRSFEQMRYDQGGRAT